MATGTRVRGPAALAIIGRIFLVLGLGGLAVAVYFAGNEWRGRHTATASARIVAIGKLPAMEFTMADGSVIRFTNNVRSSSWQVGDNVAIAYDPGNPSDAVVDGFAGRWFPAGLAGLLGGAFLILGVVLTVIGRRTQRGGTR
ncbi:hypothetical protein GCM10007874_22850 [Labrys miyagiensis]|uniref:DUF3592 domain-containing protein n=1 Tax=Labrys miyagiensis TaxID=346912 RepID=A0ABQ6CHR9_9HYPH|nr:DUF3592 domain-containing protein [Labrys miyagiensis]GLS19268.1 hypothetical protein GCM10007874_22850 [Labrys miyagiensis]